MNFAEVVEAIDRSRLIGAVKEARRDYATGEFRVVTPSELARDISE